MGARIRCIEYYFPKKRISNEDLMKEFPSYDFSKFEDKVGIQNRYVVAENETALDLAVQSSEKVFENFDRNLIDYVLYCTQSPEYFLPTSSCILQDRLGLRKNIGAFDFNLGCSGYTYGLSLAKSLINSKQAKHVLLVTAETYSKYLHPNDKSNRAIFGDAAASTVISESDEDQIHEFRFGTDGSGYDKLIVKNGASKYKYSASAEDKVYGSDNIYTDNTLYMNGPEIFTFTNEVIPGFIHELVDENAIALEKVDQFILHQANAFMLNTIRKKLKVEKEQFFIDLLDGGNTVSCTIPIALKKYSQQNTGITQNVLLVGFGVGLSWSGGLVKLDSKL